MASDGAPKDQAPRALWFLIAAALSTTAGSFLPRDFGPWVQLAFLGVSVTLLGIGLHRVMRAQDRDYRDDPHHRDD